jgi:hypothetical protein
MKPTEWPLALHMVERINSRAREKVERSSTGRTWYRNIED